MSGYFYLLWTFLLFAGTGFLHARVSVDLQQLDTQKYSEVELLPQEEEGRHTAYRADWSIAGFTSEDIYLSALQADASYFSDTIENYLKTTPLLQDAQAIVFSSPAEASGIVFFQKTGQVVIAYHGTASIRNLATDLWTTAMVPFFFTEGYAHAGFYYGLLSSWNNLYTILKNHASSQGKTVADLDITVTGHSLGGALATLCAYRLAVISGVKQLRVVTFASPRVLSISAANRYNHALLGDGHTLLGAVTLRIEQTDDPITKVPTPLAGYKHVGKSKKIPRDNAYYIHEMLGYLSVLKGMSWVKESKNASSWYSYYASYVKSFAYAAEVTSTYTSLPLSRLFLDPWTEDPATIIERASQEDKL